MVRRLQATKLDKHICLIDVETAGIRNFIASYVLRGKQVALVETGPTSSVSNLLSGLQEINVRPEEVAYVAVSHIHLDHGGGAGTLLQHLPNAKLVVHERGAPHIANPEKLWEQSKMVLGSIAELYGKPEPVPVERIIPATDGMVLDVGDGVKLKVVETLGHASHHLSYVETLGGGLFPGDAAGIYLKEIDVIVPTTPAPFRLDVALASLDRLIYLDPTALYYSHFGKAADAVNKLRLYQMQLRLWAEVAKQGIDREEGLETIGSRIVEADGLVRKAVEYVRVHPVLGATVLNQSVQGVMGYVEKFGCPKS
jgi:glyoxylase-like metal-dependent hydrolase (beta-lactamase superfamily II)